jgi:hypothetical protein
MATSLEQLGPHHEDGDLGTFIWVSNAWKIQMRADLPFQNDVNMIFQCTGKKSVFPSSLKTNIQYVNAYFGDWWNSFATAVNQIVERKKLEGLDDFRIADVTVRFKKDLVEQNATWNIELVTEPYYVFEGRMEGLQCIKVSNPNYY